MKSKISNGLEEFAEWKLPEEPIAEDAAPHTSTDGTFAGRPQADKERKRGEMVEIESYVADQDRPPASIELAEYGLKPANFIPRDGLLACCVKMLAAEGYSQTRIARELRLNRRTVACLLQSEV